MPCDRVPLPGGGHAIVCSRGPRQRCACGRPATLLCDWKVPERRPASGSDAVGQKARTCDAPICTSCTTSPAPEKDLCPRHAAEWRARQENALTQRSGRATKERTA